MIENINIYWFAIQERQSFEQMKIFNFFIFFSITNVFSKSSPAKPSSIWKMTRNRQLIDFSKNALYRHKKPSFLQIDTNYSYSLIIFRIVSRIHYVFHFPFSIHFPFFRPFSHMRWWETLKCMKKQISCGLSIFAKVQNKSILPLVRIFVFKCL